MPRADLYTRISYGPGSRYTVAIGWEGFSMQDEVDAPGKIPKSAKAWAFILDMPKEDVWRLIESAWRRMGRTPSGSYRLAA